MWRGVYDAGYCSGRNDALLIAQEGALAICKLAEVHPYKEIRWQ